MIEIKSTLREAPIRAVIFGKDGLGKSTFCASAPRPVFIAIESGLDNIDAVAVPTPKTWAQLVTYADELSQDERCGTIVVDSLDWAEQLCWIHVCEQGDDKGKKKNIEQFGFGKGYVAALNEWRILLASLSMARTNGKNVLLIAHAAKKPVKNPSGEDYDAWSIKINEKAAGLIREWVDVVGFAELDVATVEQDGRTKGVSTGKRILRTQPAAGYESKTRYALPSKIPLEWPAFAAAVKAGSYASMPPLQETLEFLLAQLGNDEVTKNCRKFLLDRGSSVTTVREATATVQQYLDAERGTKDGNR